MYFLLFLLHVFQLVVSIPETEYYDILGVPHDATDKKIKRQFNKLSLKYHPDKNPGDEAARQKFVEITEAYQVLKDSSKRHLYDMYGKKGLDKQNQHGGHPFGDFFDPFGQGGHGGKKTHDAHAEVEVTLEEIYFGTSRDLSIRRNVICSKCRGTGAKGGKTKTCSRCHGRGQITTVQQMMPGFNVQMQQQCPKCGGSGHVAAHKCGRCHGSGTHEESKTLPVIVERGAPNGHEIRFPKAAEQKPGFIPGDVIVKLKQKNHNRFARHGNDLHTTVELSLKKALCGFDLTIRHLGEPGKKARKVRLNHSNDITKPFQKRRYKGEGMPHHEYPSDFGDLVVTFEIKFPTKLTDQQKIELRKLLP